MCKGVIIENADSNRASFEIYAEHVIVATGRRGADWLEKICAENHIAHQPGTVDIGVRVEVRSEVMEYVNNVLYESKLIGYPKPFKNKVRTFCQNPGGFVSQENYDNDLAVVNGHSYKELKSNNTNLAILCSHNFNQPFNQPIAYAQKVGGTHKHAGRGAYPRTEIRRYSRRQKNMAKRAQYVKCKADLARCSGRRYHRRDAGTARCSISSVFIQSVDHVVPGFASTETLLYSPELKFYSNKIKMTRDLKTNIPGLYCLGDSSGWTRGLMMASIMGVLMAQKLLEQANAGA